MKKWDNIGVLRTQTRPSQLTADELGRVVGAGGTTATPVWGLDRIDQR